MFLRQSKHDDFEILDALRAIHTHIPWVRKVCVFGDRPVFLSQHESLIEHISHDYVARATVSGRLKLRRNLSIQVWISSLWTLGTTAEHCLRSCRLRSSSCDPVESWRDMIIWMDGYHPVGPK